jgi:hypothetical protein
LQPPQFPVSVFGLTSQLPSPLQSMKPLSHSHWPYALQCVFEPVHEPEPQVTPQPLGSVPQTLPSQPWKVQTLLSHVEPQ